MSPTATTLDPAAAVATAIAELYDELRKLVDRGPTDDPGLLDELGRLTRRIRTKITRARKAADLEAPAKPTPEPTKPVAPAPPPAPAPAVPKVAQTGTSPEQKPTTRALPAATTPAEPRVTMPIRPPAQPTLTAPATRPRAVLHRWVLLLAVVLVAILGAALSITTGNAAGIAGAAVAVLAIARARRRADRQGGSR